MPTRLGVPYGDVVDGISGDGQGMARLFRMKWPATGVSLTYTDRPGQ